MPTPLVDYLKAYTEYFSKYAAESKAKDKGWGGYFRNTDVSSKQIESAEAIGTHFGLSEGAPKPDNTFYDETTRVLRTAFSGEGTRFSLELKRFSKRVDVAQELFEKYNLLDVESLSSPEIIFRTALVEYLIRKEIYKYALEIGYYTYTGCTRGLTWDEKLSKKKCDLVEGYLREDLRQKTAGDLLDKIDAALRADDEYLTQHGREGEVPIPLGPVNIGLPARVRYSKNTLTGHLEHARTQIAARFKRDDPAVGQASTSSAQHRPQSRNRS